LNNNYEMALTSDERDYQDMTKPADMATNSGAEAPMLPFAVLSAQLDDNLAAATLRLVDAARDFTGLIQAYVSAGQELERSLEMVKDLAAASQRALSDARQAASEASLSASEAKRAQESSMELIQRYTKEHMALADLTDNLRMRISALSILGAPLDREEAPAEPAKADTKDQEAA
jgi:hypothetical protein